MIKYLLKAVVFSSCILSLACGSTSPLKAGGAGNHQATNQGDGDSAAGLGIGPDGTPIVGGQNDSSLQPETANPPLVNGPTTDDFESLSKNSWVSYDGTSGALAWDLIDDGTGNTVVHAVATADHEESASVSLSIPQASLTDDMARSMGVRFNISGSGDILFQAQSGAVIPTSAGGWCESEICWNAHEQSILLTAEYQTIEIRWDDMVQSWGSDVNSVVLYPSEILQLSWIIPKEEAGEMYIDSIELIGDDGTGAQSGLGQLIGKAQYNAIVGSSAIYTYENFLEAAEAFVAFGGDADEAWAKREIAMFLANAKWETGNFNYAVEQAPGTYCDLGQIYGCPAGASEYYGRGAMQLSWNYNYKAAGDYLGLDLLANPDWVASDPVLLWRTGLWFWMNPGHQSTPHAVYKQGLGSTIQMINGVVECGGGRPDAVSGRIENYRAILHIFEIDAGGSDTGC